MPERALPALPAGPRATAGAQRGRRRLAQGGSQAPAFCLNNVALNSSHTGLRESFQFQKAPMDKKNYATAVGNYNVTVWGPFNLWV